MAEIHIGIAGNIGAGKTTLTNFLNREPSRSMLTALLKNSFGLKTFKESIEHNSYLPIFYARPEEFSLDSQLSFLSERMKQQQNISEFPGFAIEDRTLFEDRVFAKINFRDNSDPHIKEFVKSYNCVARLCERQSDRTNISLKPILERISYESDFERELLEIVLSEPISYWQRILCNFADKGINLIDEDKIPSAWDIYDRLTSVFLSTTRFRGPDIIVYLRVADVDVLVKREEERGRDFEKTGLTAQYLQKLNIEYDRLFYNSGVVANEYHIPVLAVDAETNFNHKKGFHPEVRDMLISRIKEIMGERQ